MGSSRSNAGCNASSFKCVHIRRHHIALWAMGVINEACFIYWIIVGLNDELGLRNELAKLAIFMVSLASSFRKPMSSFKPTVESDRYSTMLCEEGCR